MGSGGGVGQRFTGVDAPKWVRRSDNACKVRYDSVITRKKCLICGLVDIMTWVNELKLR